MSSTTRGALIVFEGLDRAGKSTQCARLAQSLLAQGRKVKQIRFPDRSTPIGTMIDRYLKNQTEQKDHVIHLLFSANRWELASQIEEAINSGVNVVVDRYYYSGCVYSAAKHNSRLDLGWARKCDEGLPRPDVCVFLDISPEEAERRGGYGNEKYERRDMQDRVRRLFEILRASPDGDDFIVVDAGASHDEIAKRVLEVVEQKMQEVAQERTLLRRVEPW